MRFYKRQKKIGFENLYQDTKARSFACDLALEGIDLKVYPKIPALAMTTIIDEQSDEIRKILKNEFNVNVAGGQDHLKGKIFRVNHMGMVPLSEISWAINAIELSLEKLNRRNFNGFANQIFLEQYYKIKNRG